MALALLQRMTSGISERILKSQIRHLADSKLVAYEIEQGS